MGDIIGLDPTGQAARPNGANGILLTGGAGFAFIGPHDVISGNGNDGISLVGAHSVWIEGNFVGTNLTANRAIGNAVDGISLDQGSTAVTIGGTALGATNVISGNGSTGVALRNGSNFNLIQADLIGTNVQGDAALGNGIAGVLISDSSNNIVGPGDLVSGNGSKMQGAGIWIDGADSTGNFVFGDRIGTDLTGETAIPNEVIGVLINDGSFNQVGGSFFGATNVISGNTLIGAMIAGTSATGNLIAGNLIGTNAQGAKALGNGTATDGAGVYIDGSPGNFVGGSSSGLGNVISGNGFDGVQVFGPTASGNLFQGNKIGTDVTGALALGNADDGLVVDGAAGTRVVGNIIAANGSSGVLLTGSGATGTLLQSNAIGQGIGGQALGNGAFGILIINSAPEPTSAGNVNMNNTLGPIRDTNVSSTTSTAASGTTTSAKKKTVKVHSKKSAKVAAMADRPFNAFRSKSRSSK
jgi:titin